ncbi:Cathepsin L1 [Lamellibrachia satsuma]|nr:Cathepsin L1 [Lamellibrachia satsuma]
MRQKTFENNVAAINNHNLEYDLGMHTFTMGINEYSDMSAEEFSQTMNGLRQNRSLTHFDQPSVDMCCENNSTLPDSVDWRTKGYVTPVKNQGKCASCYAFSATGALEGQMFNKTGKLVSLSEQNIIDCSRKEGNHGCRGGTMNQSFKYIKRNKGIDTEESYPYLTKAEWFCHFKRKNVGGEDVGAVDLPKGREDCLEKAVASVGPISVAVDATFRFQSYKDGVFKDNGCDSADLNHGVLLVGYGTTDNGQDFWLVKNSWGQSWGIDGYMKLARNMDNMCGIATAASYPLV